MAIGEATRDAWSRDSGAEIGVGARRYAMCLLLLTYTFNFLDRQVINILAEPIKRELALADWQLGAMTGLAFALLYSVLGIPIARRAEHGDRPKIIALAILVWSGFTMACGLVQSFPQLLLARFGVGVGEAGCTPPAHSLISDYMPRSRRASGLSFYAMGTPLGALLGMALGGLVADAYGWRAAFIAAGAPGLLLALLAATTLPEPRRRLASFRPAGPSLMEACRELGSKRTFWLVAFAASLQAFFVYGQQAFVASFFFRAHARDLAGLASHYGLKPAGLLGIGLGATGGLAGVMGALIGGRICDAAVARDLRAQVLLPAGFAAAATPFFIWAMLARTAGQALVLLAVASFFNTAWFGPVYASVQGLARPQTRATAAAVLLFVINLIGLSLGPLCVGALSDLLSGAGLAPAESLRWALIAGDGAVLVSIALFMLAASSVRGETVG